MARTTRRWRQGHQQPEELIRLQQIPRLTAQVGIFKRMLASALQCFSINTSVQQLNYTGTELSEHKQRMGVMSDGQQPVNRDE